MSSFLSAHELVEENTISNMSERENHRKKKNIPYEIQTLANKEQLEHELCEFFADIKRQDGKHYKVESIVLAYTSLRCFLFEFFRKLKFIEVIAIVIVWYCSIEF
ncbi:2612_t:CDS:2 [Cetraspora pellucida]|uniref:2612_t:CDS:1 n=1 Tax=Cetraspora pellucida TaxID=1433469 RepID=A0A9N9HK60_9GLOM|nr:2612_t:CDS:2 [Cetraspora pellucida]